MYYNFARIHQLLRVTSAIEGRIPITLGLGRNNRSTMIVRMLFLKRFLTSCVLYAVLVFVLLITIGMIVNLHGGRNRPNTKSSSAYAVGYEATRRNDANIVLGVLGVPALAAVAISFVDFLPWCKKQSRSN